MIGCVPACNRSTAPAKVSISSNVGRIKVNAASSYSARLPIRPLLSGGVGGGGGSIGRNGSGISRQDARSPVAASWASTKHPGQTMPL